MEIKARLLKYCNFQMSFSKQYEQMSPEVYIENIAIRKKSE